MSRRVERPGVRDGYDRWSETYDSTPNPLVAMDRRHTSLRPGGRLVSSAFHPELARAGIEANFEQDGTEYRLGAERYTVDDYLEQISAAGFRRLDWQEYAGDAELAEEVPRAAKYVGRPLLLLVCAERTV